MLLLVTVAAMSGGEWCDYEGRSMKDIVTKEIRAEKESDGRKEKPQEMKNVGQKF